MVTNTAPCRSLRNPTKRATQSDQGDALRMEDPPVAHTLGQGGMANDLGQ